MTIEITRRHLVGGMVTSAVAGSAHAQDAEWARIVEAAKKEGEVIVWGQAGEGRRKFWKDAFEKAYPGITVRLFQANSTSERDSRYLREYEAKVAKVDVLVSGAGSMGGRILPAGALQPLRPFLRPETLDPKKWVDGEPFWVDKEKQYVIVADQPVGAAVVANKSISPDALKSWNDLLDPKWDGKIISLDPRQSGQTFALTLFLYFNPDLGPDYVAKLYNKGRIVFSQDTRQIIEWVESGRMQLAIGVREPEIASIEKIGAKVVTVAALEAKGVRQTMLVGADAAAAIPNIELPHPNAAKVYVNWFFSKGGQQAMVDALGLTTIQSEADMSSLNKRMLREPGAKYISANDYRLTSNEAVKAMRDAVTKAIEGNR